jgi:hypothetical protein
VREADQCLSRTGADRGVERRTTKAGTYHQASVFQTALFSERMQRCGKKGIASAGVVREAIYDNYRIALSTDVGKAVLQH